jgi:hypothetical protein
LALVNDTGEIQHAVSCIKYGSRAKDIQREVFYFADGAQGLELARQALSI